MAKNQASGSTHREVAVGKFKQRDADTRVSGPKVPKAPRREILFPTEPTTIPRERIDRAIEQVMSRRK